MVGLRISSQTVSYGELKPVHLLVLKQQKQDLIKTAKLAQVANVVAA
ncbi:hypothetical protein [Lysinibacillus sp. NPDC093216]